MFWTDCEDTDDGNPGDGTATPSATASPSASASQPGEAAGTPSASSSPSAQGSAGDLAETGSGAPVGLLSGVAAALVAAGGYLVFRRRKAS